MSYWARTVDPSFSAPEPNFEPIRAELVGGPPPDSPSRGRCTSAAVRGCRCVGVVLLALIVWLIGAHFWSVHNRKAAPAVSGGEQATIEVAVYYEAFCPDSRAFIADQLWPAYQRMPEVMHITLVPYGKAKTVRHGSASGDEQPTFSCHHGAQECRANKVHACAVQQAASQGQALSFVVCLLRQLRPDAFEQHAAQCAESCDLSWTTLTACAAGDVISHVMEGFGDRTAALRPRLTFVPTVTVNGSQDRQEDMREYFLGFVCNMYKDRTGLKLTGCP